MLAAPLLAVVLCLGQEQTTGSVEVLLDLAFEFRPESWSVEMELELPAGNRGVGKRTPNAEGVARFDAVPVGRGTILLRWLQPGVRRGSSSAGVVLRSQPIRVEGGSSTRLDWRMASELALVSMTIHDPSGRADKDDFAVLIIDPVQPRHADAGGELEVPAFGRAFDFPAAVGNRIVVMSFNGSGFSSREILPNWRVPEAGRLEREVCVPDGRIELRLLGDPPPPDTDWSHCLVSLAADPRWRQELLPFSAAVDRHGVAIFDHVPAGDYFVRLEWSEDGDDWFTDTQLQRLIRFEGGDLQLNFTTSGVGIAELALPPGTGKRVLLTRDSDAEEQRELGWPSDGAGVLRVEDLQVGRWTALAEGEGVEARASFEIEVGQTTAVVLPRWRPSIPVRLLVDEVLESEMIVLHLFDPTGNVTDCWDLVFEGRWEGRLTPGTVRVTANGLGTDPTVAEFEVPESLPEGVEVHVVELEFRVQDQ